MVVKSHDVELKSHDVVLKSHDVVLKSHDMVYSMCIVFMCIQWYFCVHVVTSKSLPPSLCAVHGNLSAHLHLLWCQHRLTAVCRHRGKQLQRSQAGQLCPAHRLTEEVDRPCAEDLAAPTHQETTGAQSVACVSVCVGGMWGGGVWGWVWVFGEDVGVCVYIVIHFQIVGNIQ